MMTVMESRTCVVLLLVIAVTAGEDWREVITAQGVVRGRKLPDTEIYAFYNIPYATAPTGENKFKAPLPAPVWQEPYDAIDKHVVCPQGAAMLPDYLVQQENCLIANVYVPDMIEQDLSVLVYVHGGAFVLGYGEMLKGTRLMEQENLIIVTFNYRLSIHGFLCLGTEDAPGNAGMKDQVALLRWVQKNIASFGGNPNDVTIAGYSAGSASVDLLMLSKLAEGLFHKVIPESGGNLAVFTIQRDPIEIAKNHARKLNFTNVNDINALGNFYKTASMELLTSELFIDRTDSTFMFTPCVERDTGDGAFLTESPITIIKKGNYRKLPLLYGFTNMEGLSRIDFFEFWKGMMNENFSAFLPADLKFESEEERESVVNEIKKFYFDDEPVDNDNILGYVDYFSDIMFTYPVIRAVKLHVEAGHNQVYLYEYSFVDDEMPVVLHTNVRGAEHIAQTMAVMDGRNFGDFNESNASPEYQNMKRIMREIWGNFATTGKPIPEGSSLPAWPAAGADSSPHMSLGQEVELRGVLLEERARFWDDIYQKYYLDSVPPTVEERWRLVNITQGPVRGRMDPERGVYTFYNIPYATAPTGPNRFKAPLPPPTWMSTFDAVDRGIVCIQASVTMTTQEDCLVINVSVPDTEETNLPVVVVVHGGAYQYGHGLTQQFNDLVRTKNVIAVTFNYRLGVHGFLCLGTEGAPGNAEIKDQLAALRWVNKNIASFGGNPADVTLAGCSAGSGSVDILTLSSAATGLFKKAIMESGVSTGGVGLQINPIENAKTYAKLLNFNDVDDLNNMEEFYKTATFEQLVSRADVISNNKDVGILFAPCVERDIGQERVVKDSPMDVMTQGNYTKIPLLYGFTDMDGRLRLSMFETWKDQMTAKFSDFLPSELYFESEELKEEVAQEIKEFYFGAGPVTNDSIVAYIHYVTDVLFAGPMLRSLKTRTEALGDTIYLFEYSFVDENTPSLPHTDERGAGHCHQLFAVSDQDVTERTEEYKQMKQIMRDYWFNFMLTSSPSTNDSVLPPWPPANVTRSPHMSLGSVIDLKDTILEHRVALWDRIYEKHYRGPVLYFDNDTDGAVSLMVSNVMFVAVLLSLYLNF